MPYLPTNLSEMKSLNWDYLDIILITGDAYIDHPSFGTAIISRCLENAGFRVGIISQPDWTKDEDFLALGKPRLFFGISSGNMDSMVNHYTAQKKLRHDDAYSPDGIHGKRPDRAVMIYTNIIRKLYKGTPVIIGGIEASLRRIAHYDYWQDKVKNSILADSKADLLLYGMAESAIVAVANALAAGTSIDSLQEIPSTVCFTKAIPDDAMVLPDGEICKERLSFLEMNRIFFQNFPTSVLYQKCGGRIVKHNPPAKPISQTDMDRIYDLPYMRAPHPRYANHSIPAWEQIKQSITSHRGCYGGCNFCAIYAHQGKKIQSRSDKSILKEAEKLAGVISDVGGPTANMYGSGCKLGFPDSCKRTSCLFPEICPNLTANHDLQIDLLDKISALPRIKHVFVASGIRHDLALGNKRYIAAIAAKYTGGRLKLAPEHASNKVLRLMGKPSATTFENFAKEYFNVVKKAGLKRQIIPYLIIGHPGCTMEDTMELKRWLQKMNIKVEQVQEFTPTPMTISTCMYYTQMDYYTGEKIHVPSPGEIRKQKQMIVG